MLHVSANYSLPLAMSAKLCGTNAINETINRDTRRLTAAQEAPACCRKIWTNNNSDCRYALL